MSDVKLLIVDDHAVVREGLKALFGGMEDIAVVGMAKDGLEAVELAHSLDPDVVLMDIAMPGLGGMEATTRIKKECPGVKILVLTQYDNREYVLRFLRAGASGYVLKTAPASEVIAAVRTVSSGGMYLNTPRAAELVAQALDGGAAIEGSYDSLTDREKEVLKLIVEGMSSRQIAETLTVSIKTIVTHRANLMEKLGIHNRAQLVRFGLRHGVVPLADDEQ